MRGWQRKAGGGECACPSSRPGACAGPGRRSRADWLATEAHASHTPDPHPNSHTRLHHCHRTDPRHPARPWLRTRVQDGHIHHIDNSFAFDERFPYATPVEGLYSASSGCHPAGSVMGAAGHNAAARLVRDMGLQPCWVK